jgi:cysteinyl-tRNA synthetase
MQKPTYDLNGIQLKLFNTETREKTVLTPLEEGHVKMYTCGPTVYHYAHIGNFRTYVFEDLLRRTIQFFGMKITQVMNLTDVDDKTIKGAIAKNVTLDAYTKPFKQAFFDDLKTLSIQPAETYPAATDYIPEMITMIQQLLDKGFAYKGGDGCMYYAINKFPRYGCLSHLKMDELKAGASDRVASDEYDKDHIADFVLWKAYDPARDGLIYWDSPFGKGRPGWHLECSAMAMRLLGDTLDIHVGGVDNMFPHHENEIAQSEACSGKHFANLWMHSEHLVVDGKKMSKSLGNFYTLRDLLNKGFTGMQVRYMLLQTHYKTQLNFTFTGLDAVKSAYHRLTDFILRMLELQKIGGDKPSHGKVIPLLEKYYRDFATALADDLNISVAFSAVFELVREMNVHSDAGEVNSEEAGYVIELLQRFNRVLGLLSFELPVDSIPVDLQKALEDRMQARRDKNWKLADQLRDFIHERGFVIEDTSQGARLKKMDVKV